jgi:Ca-activated chloride channel family protein
MFSFGVGADLNAALVERLAVEGRGTAQFVRPDESVERAVSIVASRLTSPVVTDIRIFADGVRLIKRHPSASADLFAGQDYVVLTRYDGSGSARLRFEGQTSSGPVSWTTRASFPESSRENAYIARLWATQRVGYLTAEKRRNGGSREIDDEIRQLGEKYAIPTEFTSYLVVEPGMRRDVQMRRAGGVATGAAAAPPPPALARPESTRQFEAARDAAKQRSATNLAAADEADLSAAAGSTRRVGTRVFTLRGERWTELRKTEPTSIVKVKAFSEAYFKIMEQIPELREIFALGDKVLASGRDVSIEIGSDGMETISDAELRRVQSGW